jgi:hypothetical protein
MEKTKTFNKSQAELDSIFKKLEEAIIYEPYAYDVKIANQCIRQEFEGKSNEVHELKDALLHIYRLTNKDNPSHYFIIQKCEKALKLKPTNFN